ncbi:type II toxin-antitoxin system Phd/YefM family antitoxin [Cerasicoccus frondis]|uniref:type II toxin-antitoxin system Phd/YefM family antitoxin n=1 Tax=Cerasicoccus frondis TaxID=490090 RepID=UPI002852CE69|nr:hypothetical protein [Cerasicoccus frondis]
MAKKTTVITLKELRSLKKEAVRDIQAGQEIVLTDRGEPFGKIIPYNRQNQAKDALGRIRQRRERRLAKKGV